jgi:hypothetical protein
MILNDARLFEITPIPRPNPEANAFKTGTPADCPRVPEDELTINTRTMEWYDSFHPQTQFHCWLVDQVVVNTLRIDRNGRIDRRLRDKVVIRAQRFWDDDRRLDAELLGEQLAKKPAATVNKLRQTPHGCDWLIGRWASLIRIAERPGGWDVDQKNLAFELLGVRPEDRANVPGETIDLDGKVIGIPLGHAEMARQQVAGLLLRKQEVADLDALDRAMALADYVDEPTPEIQRLRRTNSELHRRLKWCLTQIDHKSPYPHTNPRVYSHFRRNIEPDQSPQAEASPATADLSQATPPGPYLDPEIYDRESKAEDKTWPYILNARRDAKELKAQAREEARREKRMRLRA